VKRRRYEDRDRERKKKGVKTTLGDPKTPSSIYKTYYPSDIAILRVLGVGMGFLRQGQRDKELQVQEIKKKRENRGKD